MSSYLKRYLSGECQAVWAELVALGPATLQPPLLTDATAVAEAAVDRIVRNANTVGQYLLNAGYEFETPGPLIVPAKDSAAETIGAIEEEFGTVPLFLKAWWTKVERLNHQPTEAFRNSDQGCALEGIFPDPAVLIQSPAECLENSRRYATEVKRRIAKANELGISGEDDYYADAPNLVLGPGTSANDPVGYRLPLAAIDGKCHQTEVDEDPESLIEWLRFYYRRRGALSWKFFGYITTPDGEMELRTYIHPEEKVRDAVQSMGLVPF